MKPIIQLLTWMHHMVEECDAVTYRADITERRDHAMPRHAVTERSHTYTLHK